MKVQGFCLDSGKEAPGLEGHEEGSQSHGLAGQAKGWSLFLLTHSDGCRVAIALGPLNTLFFERRPRYQWWRAELGAQCPSLHSAGVVGSISRVRTLQPDGITYTSITTRHQGIIYTISAIQNSTAIFRGQILWAGKLQFALQQQDVLCTPKCQAGWGWCLHANSCTRTGYYLNSWYNGKERVLFTNQTECNSSSGSNCMV